MRANLHVLWVNSAAYPEGGCERYVADTASLLRARGVTCSLLYDPHRPTDLQFLQSFDQAFPMVDLRRQVSDLKPDIVYVHRLSDEQALVDLKASSAPVVRFFHDHKLFCLREHKYTTIGRKTCTRTVGANCYSCLGFVRRSGPEGGLSVRTVRSLRRDQHVNLDIEAYVVGSRYMADHLVDHGFDARKTHVIPLYAKTRQPAVVTDREADLVLFVGQVVRGKGLDLLLDAIARVRHRLRLVVAGTGRQMAEFRRRSWELGIDRQVDFVGKCDRAELDSYYRRAACVVVPSRVPETFALVGVEAMSHGAPVIAADVGGVRDWLVDGATGLTFPSCDIPALARNLETLTGLPELVASMGRAAEQRYQQLFRPERHITALLVLFGSLVERPSAA